MFGAIDVGGTKTLIAVFNSGGQIIESIKFPTPQDYDNFIAELSKHIKELKTQDFQHITIAVPALVDRIHGVVIACGNLPWKNVPVRDDISQIFNCPVGIDNDANLAGLSEALELRDSYRKVLYVTISTGIGGALVVDGTIDPNTQDMEFGHMLLEHDGKLMRWEEFASGKAIVSKYGKKASEIDDPTAWYAIARNIAIGLIDLIATLTPDAIVIGGGVGTHLHKFKDRLDEQMKLYEHPLVSIPPILQAKRAEEAVIYGCYAFSSEHVERINS